MCNLTTLPNIRENLAEYLENARISTAVELKKSEVRTHLSDYLLQMTHPAIIVCMHTGRHYT